MSVFVSDINLMDSQREGVEERILSHGQLGTESPITEYEHDSAEWMDTKNYIMEYGSQKIIVGPVVGQGRKKVRFKDLGERGQDSIQDWEDIGEIPEEIPEEIPDTGDKIG